LWQNRSRLRFPLALVLLPLSVLAIYLANLVRIVALMWIGARISPAIALGGFHSKAGWVFFCAVTLGIVALATRWRLVQRDRAYAATSTATASAHDYDTTPASPYLMPFIAVMATTLVTGMFSADSVDALYPLRVLAALVALYAYRDALLVLPKKLSLTGPLVGVLVFGLWLWLAPRPSAEDHAEVKLAMAGLGPWWLAARVIGTAVTVPIVEELAFRAFLLRRLASADFERVPFTHRGVVAIVVSSVLFGALHQGQVLAGCVAGLAYGLAMVHRGSLGDAIVAHGITNAMLVVYAVGWNQYAYL
jgi:exosortase E/protease (VPEID-CTERM system)